MNWSLFAVAVVAIAKCAVMLTSAETLTPIPPEGRYPHPQDCRYYYRANGVSPNMTAHKCPDCKEFDPLLLVGRKRKF